MFRNIHHLPLTDRMIVDTQEDAEESQPEYEVVIPIGLVMNEYRDSDAAQDCLGDG